MRVKILGSAAGGGFPQWNCACRNCARLRNGTLHGVPRSQTQVAIHCDPDYALRNYWTLVNASPDMRSQIAAAPELKPFKDTVASTPIRDIYLTSADVDSLMGLLHLREFQAFKIFSTPSVRRILSEENSIFRVLGRASPPVQWFSLALSSDQEAEKKSAPQQVPQLICKAFAVGGEYPDYISERLRAELPAHEAVVGFSFEHSSKRLLLIPTLPGRGTAWKTWAEWSDLILIDGTFWSDDELIKAGRGRKTAREIGHLPLSGPNGLLEQFPKHVRARKILIHINNTNAILDEDSPEYRAALDAGFEIAYDGMELEL